MKHILFILFCFTTFISKSIFANEAQTSLIKSFKCYESYKGISLSEKAGGPQGSHWNPRDIICVVELNDFQSIHSLDYIELQLSIEQKNHTHLIEQVYVKNFQFYAEPIDRYIQKASQKEKIFTVPSAILSKSLKNNKSNIYKTNFTVLALGTLTNGKKMQAQELKLKAHFSYGE